MQFTFAQVEHALAATNNISDERRSAFAHRLKHLQRLEFPPGVNTGRGRAATYTVGHLFLLGIALELNQLGSTPERAVRTLERDMVEVVAAALVSARESPHDGAFEFPVVLYYNPNALRDLMAAPADGEQRDALQYGDILNSADQLTTWMRGGLPRLAFINVSALVRELAGCSGKVLADFYAELRLWAQSYIEQNPVPLF